MLPTLAFLRIDAQRMVRDQFLIGMSILTLAMAGALRFALPAISQEVPQIDLPQYYPLMISYMVVGVGALMSGAIGGFLLLETREEGTIRALAVTPIPLAHYLRVLSSGLVFIAFTLAVIEAGLIGLGQPHWTLTLACAVVGAAFAPAYSFVLAGFASNKVEAFAVMKIIGVMGLVPLGSWFVPQPWQWLFSVYPTYLVCKAWWVACAGQSTWWVWLALAVPVTAVYLWALGRRFLAGATR